MGQQQQQQQQQVGVMEVPREEEEEATAQMTAPPEQYQTRIARARLANSASSRGHEAADEVDAAGVDLGVEMSSFHHGTTTTTSVPIGPSSVSPTENQNATVSPSKAYESRLQRARMAHRRSPEQHAPPTVEAPPKEFAGVTVSRV